MYSLALRCARSLSVAEKAAQPRSGNASHNCIQQQERCHRTKNVGLPLKHAMTGSNLAHPETTSFWHFICQRGLTVISTDNGFAFERRKISHPQHVLAAQIERKTRKAFADKCFAVAKAQSVFSSWRTNFSYNGSCSARIPSTNLGFFFDRPAFSPVLPRRVLPRGTAHAERLGISI
jgi:hypothetical protein